MTKEPSDMSTTSDLQTKILEDFLHYFLPDGLLDYFEPVMAEDKEHQIKKDEVYKRELHLYFDERDNRTEELQYLRPNGFTEERLIRDFPARARKQYPVPLPEHTPSGSYDAPLREAWSKGPSSRRPLPAWRQMPSGATFHRPDHNYVCINSL